MLSQARNRPFDKRVRKVDKGRTKFIEIEIYPTEQSRCFLANFDSLCQFGFGDYF